MTVRRRAMHARVGYWLVAGAAIVCALAGDASAQNGRVLGREDIRLLGAGLAVEPARQTVPKDIATIVSTFLAAPDLPDQPLPPFAPDALVKATLRGPSFSAPIEVSARPNTPFNIPPLSVAGIHTLDQIRLESGGEIVLRGTPESVVIEVIEKLLVTQVTARALTADEIRERGIVFDRTNFQAYNFTAAFAIGDANPIPINFPIVLPTIQGASGVSLNDVGLPVVDVPVLPSLSTIIPETLQLQTQIPNLSVIGFTLQVPQIQGQNLIVPPIPGIVVIPGDIGFLNQFFNVTLLVGNVAPAGSGLVVSELSAEIVLPPGRDDVPNSGDDPLRMARTARGESPRVQLVVQPGPDGRLGTADDIGSLAPGDSGSAEYLVEGRREGSHVIEMEMTGTLHGLPVGPVTVRGRAAGSVLVRNPTFTLTFTHPELINAGEAYTLDVTVTNTSASPANFVSVNLYPRNITGATITGNPTREIESLPPGDSATVSFDLVAQITGPVTAATLDSDDNIEGRFALKTSVGELGIPLSRDSLVLPKEAGSLPGSIRSAALGLLGRAWAVATAPAAALPADVTRFGRQIVMDRVIELAEAGFRYTLHEPLADTVLHLWLDYTGNGYERLAEKHSTPDRLALAQNEYRGFDELRRRSVRGDVLAAAVADVVGPEVAARGAAAFHQTMAENTSFRAGHLSVLLSGSSPLPFSLSIVDGAGRQVGGVDPNGRPIKTMPFADILTFGDPSSGQLALVSAASAGDYRVRLDRVEGAPDTPFTLSIVVPDAAGNLRQIVFADLTSSSRPAPSFQPTDPVRVAVDVRVGGVTPPGTTIAPSLNDVVSDPSPRLLGAVQQKDADIVSCEDGGIWRPGRVIAVLFSEEVTPQAVQDRLRSADLTRYLMDDNRVVGVALQPGRRIAFLALRDPVGPLVPRTITISDVFDRRGQVMSAQTLPIEMTVDEEGAVVFGQVLNADGTPVPYADVRLFYVLCGMSSIQGISPRLDSSGMGISAKTADAEGRFQWEFVLKNVALNRIAAINAATGEARTVPFTIARNGQRLNVNMVFLGRSSLTGRTLNEAGQPLAGTAVRVTSLTDDTEYGATTDAQGSFTINRIPVGNVFIEAVNPAARATGRASEYLAVANGTVVRDITLFSDEAPQVVVRYGQMRGYVLRGDGQQGAADVPVIAWYQNESQRGVTCPRSGGGMPPPECAIAVVRTSATGEFVFERIASGTYRVTTLDRATFQQGEAGMVLPPDTTRTFNILLAEGLGTVRGVVLDATGARVPNARVGGGLSLTTANDQGEFVLVDVPIGRREIVAVSDALQARATALVDLVRAGDEQNVTLIFPAIGTVAGRVLQSDGVTPVANARVHLFRECDFGSCVEIIGSADTNEQGGYSIGNVKVGVYKVSSFNSNFTAGNVRGTAVMFAGQIARADIVYRGGGGRITGVVYDDDGQTPLPASIGISGDRVVIAGGQIALGFQHVQNYSVTQNNFSTGAFAFNDIWVGPVTLRAVGQFSPDPIPFETAIPSPGATVHVELRLQGTAQISGVVYQPDGVTPVGADVVVRYHSDAFKLICNGEDCQRIPQGVQDFTAVTDAQGRYLINPVNAGAFTITVEDPATGRVAEIKGETTPAQQAEFDIRLLQLATVTVRVRGSDGSTVIPGARVELRQTHFPRREITLIAGANGEAVFTGANALAEGEFAVYATNLLNGFAGRVSGRVTAESETVTIDLFLFDASGSVSGTVFAPDGITPIANAEVLVSNEDGPLAFAVTDAQGYYHAATVPLGDVDVEAFEAATSKRAFASGRVDFDDQEVPINMVQLGIGQVTGTVFQAESLTPLKNWDVRLMQISPAGRAFPVLQTASGVDGRFSFPGASVGDFELRATKINVAAAGEASSSVVRHGQIVDVPIVVTVPRAITGRVEGRVVNPDGSPAANTLVSYFGGGSSGAEITTDADGRFTYESASVGRLTFRARSQVTRNAGSIETEISFEGETIEPTIVLVGVARITGTVYRSDGVTPAAFVGVELRGQPATGCNGSCIGNADASGRFAFDEVPARTFSVVAFDPITQLRGVAADVLNPGDTRDVRVVLGPSAVLSGRLLFSGNVPAQGAVAEFVIDRPFPEADLHVYAVAGADGTFTFPAVPVGLRTFTFSDPIGPGIATRQVQVVQGPQALGDIVLDTGPPQVASTTPLGSAAGVPLNALVRVVFDEPLAPASVTQANVVMSSSAGLIPAVLSVDENDTRLTIAPLAPLAEKTIYTVTIRQLADRVGKAMVNPYVFSFTSADLTPPSVTGLSPGAGANGAPIYAPIRVSFDEPVDVSRFSGNAITLLDGAAAVEGSISYAFGNTVAVFTPLRPLREDALYRVTGLPATDLSGNIQAQGLDYVFTTTDRTPPVITALVAAGNGTVIENAVTQVVAQVGAGHDVAFVDFYVSGVLTATARTEPFTLNLLARPELGGPGTQIQIAAVAVDTSGNRGTTPVSTAVTIVADTPPAVMILSPAPDAAFANGARVNVVVRVTDDLGARQIGYRAETGRTQDAATLSLEPPATLREETFGFNVPQNAVPGSRLRVTASALDTKGQSTVAELSLLVLDAVPPTIAITGTTTGARVRPGQDTLVVVSAQDAGAIRELSFDATGIVVRSETRQVSPAQTDVATSFTIHVPETANPGDVIVLNARAVDVAGNIANAAPITLPVADLTGPTVTLRTENGQLTAAPGRPVTVVVDAEDETGVSRIDLSGQGAFTFADVRAVSPPNASATAAFAVNVPENAVPGSTLTLAATATDIFGNAGQPSTLLLTIQAAAGVTLPPSLVTLAGEETEFAITLAEPAPAAGVTVTLGSTNNAIATPVAPVVFAPGATTAMGRVLSITGGNATINAFIQGVQRASMTMSVQGGVVRGTVMDPDGNPVAGAQVTVTSPLRVATTDANGDYTVQGITGAPVQVKVIDPVSRYIGYASGQLNVPGGSVRLNAVLIAAGRIAGTVVLPDGDTPAGAGVRVDLFPPNGGQTPLQTIFTGDDGRYEFPLVTLGTYRVDASDTQGNRGRATAQLAESGEEIDIPVQYLGRGVVRGTIRAGGTPVPNALVALHATSLFGSSPVIERAAEADGTFRFENVLVGTFTVQAHDQVSNTAGTANGQISLDGQQVTADVALTTYGTISGVVFRSDGTTPVAGARVRVTSGSSAIATTSEADGSYRVTFVPLGTFTVEATESATDSIGRATGSLTSHLQEITRDVAFLPQGIVVVTVRNFNGALVPGAFVSVTGQSGSVSVSESRNTDANGIAIFDHVLAGTVRVNASAAGLSSPQASFALAGGETRQVTVTLEPTANIVGTLFAPDGVTPFTGGFVSLSQFGTQVAVGSDGSFRFDGLDFGTYQLYGFDASRRVRAREQQIVLNQNGADVVRNVTLIGMGTVIGQVLNPNSSPAGNTTVTVRAMDPTFGGFRTDQTDANGNYEVTGVVAGAFTVNVGSGSLLGEANGSIDFDGQVVRRDIVLVNSAVTLPVTKRDANNGVWEVRQGGHIGASLSSVFGAGGTVAAPLGGFVLEIVSNGNTSTFAGDTSFGSTEDGAREVVVRQQVTPIAGLAVTRKIFVPRSHFGRYLELLTNPTAQPITVDVRVRSNFASSGLSMAATSSGDNVLDLTGDEPDRWAVIGTGSDSDVFDGSGGRPGLAFVFDGPSAPLRASSYAFQINNPRLFSYTWSNVTIEPGQTVGILHFAAQQYNQAAARASAERLSQLPPEALAGLSPDEIAAVRNFALPADGTSTLDPLPGFGTSITGRLLEADGTTALPHTSGNLNVRLRSSSVLFGRQYSVAANALGQFTFTHSGEVANQYSLPLGDFTIQATYQPTGLVSPTSSGSFAPGELTASRDVVFTNAAVVAGTVRRHTGAVVTVGGTLNISSTGLSTNVNIATDGSYRHTGIPAGTHTLTATLNLLPGWTGADVRLRGTQAVTVTVGQVAAQDVIVQATGGITGTLRDSSGSVVPNRTVLLRVGTATHRTVTTSTAGVFVINDVPAGAYTLRAIDPVTNLVLEVPVTVVQDVTLTQDLTFLVVGTVTVTVVATDGVILPNASVSIRKSTDGPTATPQFQGNANAAGQVVITNVPVGGFMVRATHPRASAALVEVNGTMPPEGGNVNTTATLAAVSDLLVQARTEEGGPVANAVVTIRRQGAFSFSSAGSTNAQGDRTVTNVFGTYTVRVAHPALSQFNVEITGQVTASNQIITLPVTMPMTASLSGTVRDANGNPVVSGGWVQVQPLNYDSYHSTSLQSDGTYEFAAIPGGPFVVWAIVEGFDGNVAGGGRAEGIAESPGQQVVVDIVADGVTPPQTLSDGNNRAWNVQTAGTMLNNPPSTRQRYALTVETANVEGGSIGNTEFVSEGFATRQLGGRQVELWRSGVHEPRRFMTRKIYVPADGYFVRYLEIFENQRDEPWTIRAGSYDENRSTSNGFGHSIRSTSSGDTQITTADDWWVTGVTGTAGRAFVHVARGPGGIGLSEATAVMQPTATAAFKWESVTLQPGERAAFMHFVAETRSAASGAAVAQRLMLLPQDALAGLTPEEIALIRNFDVPADGQSTAPPYPTFSGRVYLADGVTPAAGAIITVTSPNGLFDAPATATTNELGEYAVVYAASGAYSLSIAGVASPIAGTISPGQTTVVNDIVLSTAGGLRGAVSRPDSVPVTSGEVRARRSNGLEMSAPIRSDGRYDLIGLTAGNWVVQAFTDGRASAREAVTVINGIIQTRDINASLFAGTVAVRFVAPNGASIPDGEVYINEAEVRLFNLFTADSGGRFVSPSFATAGGFQIRGWPYVSGIEDYIVSSQPPFTSANEVREVEMPVAVSILSGIVTHPNGDVAPGASVSAYYLTSDGYLDGSAVTDALGRYTIFGLPPGPITIRATDGESGLLNVELNAVMNEQPTTIDIQLPGSGTVFVYGETGAAVTLSTNASNDIAREVMNENGAARFARVPLGVFSAHVCATEVPFLCAGQIGQLQESGDAAELMPPLLALPISYTGTLRAADGVTPLAGRTVRVTMGESTPDGNAEYVVTDENGQFRPSMTFLPLGPLTATTSGNEPSFFSVNVATFLAPVFDLIVGSGIESSYAELAGLSGLAFGCEGALVPTSIAAPFYYSQAPRSAGQGISCHGALVPELGGRQFRYATQRMSGLDITRKVYTPADGRYVRYLEILSNPPDLFTDPEGGGNQPITTEYELSDGNMWDNALVVSAASTGYRYAVTRRPEAAAAAHVMAGSGTVVLPTVQRSALDQTETRRYMVTVPDGQTRILMHFVIVRPAGGEAAAEAQAISLRDLLDADMLEGLTPAERAQIVNFIVP